MFIEHWLYAKHSNRCWWVKKVRFDLVHWNTGEIGMLIVMIVCDKCYYGIPYKAIWEKFGKAVLPLKIKDWY